MAIPIIPFHVWFTNAPKVPSGGKTSENLHKAVSIVFAVQSRISFMNK